MAFDDEQKGAIAESQVAAAAIKLVIEVYTPILEDGCFDMIFAFSDGELMRVQCKSASRQGDVVVIRSYSSRRTKTGMLKRVYTADEIDAAAAYCPDLDRCYLVPVAVVGGPRVIDLRLEPCKNNQRTAINWAEQ